MSIKLQVMASWDHVLVIIFSEHHKIITAARFLRKCHISKAFQTLPLSLSCIAGVWSHGDSRVLCCHVLSSSGDGEMRVSHMTVVVEIWWIMMFSHWQKCLLFSCGREKKWSNNVCNERLWTQEGDLGVFLIYSSTKPTWQPHLVLDLSGQWKYGLNGFKILFDCYKEVCFLTSLNYIYYILYNRWPAQRWSLVNYKGCGQIYFIVWIRAGRYGWNQVYIRKLIEIFLYPIFICRLSICRKYIQKSQTDKTVQTCKNKLVFFFLTIFYLHYITLTT